LSVNSPQNQRVLSGMRSTGQLHLGHLHGVLKNWVQLQHQYDCFFFIADWHALTTHYDSTEVIQNSIWNMVIDWLAVGINPGSARIFIQSWVPEHAELHLLLSMITPLGWLERVPTYKDQMEKIKDHDLDTYGFLGYPVLQSADVLIYKANYVPVGEDQLAHIEVTRELARRFNHLYGREPGFEKAAEAAIAKLGSKNAELYRQLRKAYQERGDETALDKAHALLETQQTINLGDSERLYGYLEGGGKIILPEPQALTTSAAKLPGIDGRKMSKSYHNTIGLQEDLAVVEKKIRTMPTDPARVKRTDPGEPEKCPVWSLHQVYADESTKEWVKTGCRSAGIGCIDCKQPLIEAVKRELQPIQEAAVEYRNNPELVRNVVREGCEAAREEARETLQEVRHAMNLDYGDIMSR
jgi:tryptophanyl-tRNA synthetase